MRSVAVIVLATLAACGPATTGKPVAAPASKAGEGKLVTMVTPSRLVPDVDAQDWGARLSERGASYYLLGGMRIVVHEGGKVERAEQRFPNGNVVAEPLPSRLGGGFLFYQSDGAATRLWRAKRWTDALTPLVSIARPSDELVVGFDRVYLRSRQNRVVAIDPADGTLLPLGQLPATSALGSMVFADGWRAVVDTDLLGPMATFDAGATWRPLGIGDRIDSTSVVDGDPAIYVSGGYYRLDARGHLQYRSQYGQSAPSAGGVDESEEEDTGAPDDGADDKPLGDQPLRLAVERGFPDSRTTAVVAHRGKLVRVALDSGKLLATKLKAFAEAEAECTGALVGAGFGFICGAERGPTVVYRFQPPLALHEVARFDKPRYVASSGNGALVVRGSCHAADTSTPESRRYCVLSAAGERREIAVKGDVGAERVVALKDGRIAVLVPPRFATPGRLTLIKGREVSHKKLSFTGHKRRAEKLAKRGLWMEGFQQGRRGELRGWIEAGGPVLGVTVELDGLVVLHKIYDEGGDVLLSGMLGLAVGEHEKAVETTDGGAHWRELDVPHLPEGQRDAKTRGCSPVGCSLRNWLRIGWGKPASDDDLEVAAAPPAAAVKSTMSDSVRFLCRLAPEKEQPTTEPKYQRPPDSAIAAYSTWSAFRSSPPPTIPTGHLGVDKGTYTTAAVPAHGYVWGPKGADWTRTGSWVVKFHDRFGAGGGVRQSAPSRPPWSDAETAAEAIGAKRYGGYWQWHAVLDAGGKSALVSICSSGSSGCDMFSVADGQPIVAMKAGHSYMPRPSDYGAVKLGERWFFLIDRGYSGLELWRAGVRETQMLTRYRRITRERYGRTEAVQLVRRAAGEDLGLLITVPPDETTGQTVGRWVVLPVHPETGALDEPIALLQKDLHGARLPCESSEDGWIIDGRPDVAVLMDARGASGYAHDIELRLRVKPGAYCIEGMSGVSGSSGFSPREGDRPELGPADRMIPMSTRARYGNQGAQLECWPQQ